MQDDCGEQPIVYGEYSRQVKFHADQVAEVVESRTDLLKPVNGLDIKLAINILMDLWLESRSGGCHELTISLELASNKTIRLIRKKITRSIPVDSRD